MSPDTEPDRTGPDPAGQAPGGQVLRRHFVAIATSVYDNPPWDTQALSGVTDEVAAMRRWLCGEDGDGTGTVVFTHRHDDLADNPPLKAIEDRLRNPPAMQRWRDSDAAVLYVTGHGHTQDGAHWIVLRETESGERLPATALRTADLISWLKATRIQHLLLLLDMCHAGQVTSDTVRFDRDVPKGWLGLAVAAKHESAAVQALTRAVDRFLAEVRATAKYGQEPFLLQRDFVDFLQQDLDQAGQTLTYVFSRVPNAGPHECLPNPHYRPSPATRVAESRQDLALLEADVLAHWGPRARGVQTHTDTGWLFTGRATLMRTLIMFTTAAPGAMLVTGAAGTGKSAVLARLVTLSDPTFIDRHHDRMEKIDPGLRPAPGAIDAAILATGKTSADVLGQLCAAFDVPRSARETADPAMPGFEPLLRDWQTWLAGRTAPLTLVVDALDEATDPTALLTGLLERLDPHPGTTRRLRLLVGVRGPRQDPDTAPSTGPAPTGPDDSRHTLADLAETRLHATRVSVDEEPWWQDTDLARYITEILTTTPGTPYTSEHTPLAARIAAAVTARAERSFLIGRITATSLAARPAVIDPTDPAWLTGIDDGVTGAFRDDLHHNLPDPADRVRAVDLLRAVAFSFGRGLPWGDIWPAVADAVADLPDGTYTDQDIAWLLEHRLGGYLITDREDDVTVYRLFHDALRHTLQHRWHALLQPAATTLPADTTTTP
jgi:hypothetical protein